MPAIGDSDVCISNCFGFDQFYLIMVKQSFAASTNNKFYFSDNFKIVASFPWQQQFSKLIKITRVVSPR